MKNLFQKASSPWVRYNKYEYKKAKDGYFYITPASEAKPEIYDPLKSAEQMVLDALNVGALQMNRQSEPVVREAILDFVGHYGLLGLLTAYYNDHDALDEMTRELYRQGIAAFGGIAPT